MTQFSKYLKVLAAIAVLGTAAGCETLESINPFGGNSSKREKAAAEKYDDREITRKTGEIPPDSSNTDYT
ncbi:MAG: hypothetical protein O2910_00975, partial [Proteobacteria bacterium]|nr:hypothetical protein [Pseudomonadota bacterium]